MTVGNFRPFITELRRIGFEKTHDSRTGGCRVAIFEKRINEQRRIDLQLWGDGGHRVSHWIGGRMTTTPTSFTTPVNMLAAIDRETRRTDNLNLSDAAPDGSHARP